MKIISFQPLLAVQNARLGKPRGRITSSKPAWNTQELKTSLGNIMKPYLKTKTKNHRTRHVDYYMLQYLVVFVSGFRLQYSKILSQNVSI